MGYGDVAIVVTDWDVVSQRCRAQIKETFGPRWFRCIYDVHPDAKHKFRHPLGFENWERDWRDEPGFQHHVFRIGPVDAGDTESE